MPANLAGSLRPGSEQLPRWKAKPTLEVEVEVEGLAEVADDVFAGGLDCVAADVVLILWLPQQSQCRRLRRKLPSEGRRLRRHSSDHKLCRFVQLASVCSNLVHTMCGPEPSLLFAIVRASKT